MRIVVGERILASHIEHEGNENDYPVVFTFVRGVPPWGRHPSVDEYPIKNIGQVHDYGVRLQLEGEIANL